MAENILPRHHNRRHSTDILSKYHEGDDLAKVGPLYRERENLPEYMSLFGYMNPQPSFSAALNIKSQEDILICTRKSAAILHMTDEE